MTRLRLERRSCLAAAAMMAFLAIADHTIARATARRAQTKPDAQQDSGQAGNPNPGSAERRKPCPA